MTRISAVLGKWVGNNIVSREKGVIIRTPSQKSVHVVECEYAKHSGFRKGVWGITLFPPEKGFPQES